MTGLVGPTGKPISSAQFQNKKADPPKLGESFGSWAGRDVQFMQLPGGGVVQFDLSKLTLADFRSMRDHYQVNASLAVLSFMQHQSDWHIECEDQNIADFCEEQLRPHWTQLNRAMSTANWAGYSPNVLNWDNNVKKSRIDLDKIKDLVPEEARVNWKEVEGWAPPDRIKPKFKIYDGLIHAANPSWPIPVENTFWYPLLMENGDYYGKKLLRPAFTSWFFSILVHLFANRYYERFGEPTPIGRAPFDEDLQVTDSEQVRGNTYMLNLLQQLRSRSAVVLPNDKTDSGNGSQWDYDYQIEYLESQMRGADFERYMTRLDEEISIGLFTPILLMRTADVGSYNLGVGHMQIYLWMLNAMNDDRAQYINKYILRKMTNYNFSPKAPSPRIVFRKLGNTNADLIAELIKASVQSGKAALDVQELGRMAGLSIEEVNETVNEPADPDAGDDDSDRGGLNPQESTAAGVNARAVVKEIVNRVTPQVERAFENHTFGPNLQINMGYKKRMEKALATDGHQFPNSGVNRLYTRMDAWLEDIVGLGEDEFSGPDTFMALFQAALSNEVKDLLRS